jgi:outer membrane receptor protein involved in Fe transport
MVTARSLAVQTIVATCALAAPAAAQAVATGTIRGIVTDRDFNTPLAGATVQVLNTRARATTNENGAYTITGVEPGAYTVVISKDGYVRAVRPNVPVTAGQLSDADAALAGEFEDMDEFVVQDLELGKESSAPLEYAVPANFEPYIIIPPIDFQLRLEAPALLDTIGVEMISRSGASDAAAALLLVPGASLQDGKYAVIRGLPDRYVATLLDGVRLPSADPNKRAVKLDQFPAAVIQGIQVSKNFTPDQQGEASGGAVNIQLKDIPDDFYVRVSAQVGGNSQVKNGQFLTYKGGGMDFWGNNDTLSIRPDLPGQSWPNPVGTSFGAAPTIYKWSSAIGNSWEVDEGVRVGGFGNFFYEQDASAYNNGRLDSLEQAGIGTPLVPEVFGTGDNFKTELFDVAQGTQSIQWGGMGTLGLETENHRLGVKFLYTQLSEQQSIRLLDTRGKSYFFPGYDPNDITGIGHDQPEAAPWNRLETLDYSQLSTQSVILRGEHTLPFLEGGDIGDGEFLSLQAPVFDWRFSMSKAIEDQPDQTQFAAYWVPEFQVIPGLVLPAQWIGYPPAQNSFVGWVQHINYYNEENSTQGAWNVKLPFLQWNGREGYVKTGMFIDSVGREYRQDTFSNNGDVNSSWAGGWDTPWSEVFPTQDHPINRSEVDISYDGTQQITAGYLMADLPLNETFNTVGGVRLENTLMSTTVLPDVDALWIDTVTQTLQNFDGPNIWDAFFDELRVLPMIGFNWNLADDLILRAAFAQTLARPNFYEMVPVIQYDYIGGPIFIGNPQLGMSSLDNYDLRMDWTPEQNWLVSGSVFYKTIDDPIQYVNRFTEGFSYTSAINMPSAWLLGLEIESRVTLDPILGEEWKGLAVGGNFTWMQSQVTLDPLTTQFLRDYGINDNTQPMTATPNYLLNLNATYDVELTGTQLGIFYNFKGDSLVSGANAFTTLLTPSIYQVGYGTLNFTASQAIVGGLRFTANVKNITNPEIQTQYRTNEGITGLNSSYTAGIAYSFALTYQANF